MFLPGFLIADDDTVIGLRFIESMNLTMEDYENVIDELKGDKRLEIKTTGGFVYTISVLKQKAVLGKQYKLAEDNQQVRLDIFERWTTFID